MIKLAAQRAALIMSLMALLLGACSSGQPKEDYIAAADKICAKFGDQLALAATTSQLQSAVVNSLDTSAGLAERAAEDLEELEEPNESDDEEELREQWLERFEDIGESFDTAARAVESGDQAAFTAAINEAQIAAIDSQQFAAKYGMNDCGSAAGA